MDACKVLDCGAIIDTAGWDITIGQPLMAGGNGTSGLTKNGTGTLTLNSFGSTSAGSTIVNGGTLALTNSGAISTSSNVVVATGATRSVIGRPDGLLTVPRGQTLQGDGTVAGRLTVNSGATVSPGVGGVGLLTVTGPVSLQGVTRMELNKAAGTNDRLRSVSGSISYGGTLQVVNIGGAQTGGETYKLFDSVTRGPEGTVSRPTRSPATCS